MTETTEVYRDPNPKFDITDRTKWSDAYGLFEFPPTRRYVETREETTEVTEFRDGDCREIKIVHQEARTDRVPKIGANRVFRNFSVSMSIIENGKVIFQLTWLNCNPNFAEGFMADYIDAKPLMEDRPNDVIVSLGQTPANPKFVPTVDNAMKIILDLPLFDRRSGFCVMKTPNNKIIYVCRFSHKKWWVGRSSRQLRGRTPLTAGIPGSAKAVKRFLENCWAMKKVP